MYPKRHIYFILDGQNVNSTNPDTFLFSYMETNNRLNALINQSLWDSRPAQRMDFYEKVDLAKPSVVLQE